MDEYTGRQIKETIDEWRNEGQRLLDKANICEKAWQEKDLEMLWAFGLLTQREYNRFTEERENEKAL